MADEYELVSREELEMLRGQLSKMRGTLPTLPSFKQPETMHSATGFSPDVIRSLNDSLIRLNLSLEKLFQMFDRAQKELTTEEGDRDRFTRLEGQNEKIAAGLISMNNMIRDQQIQLNQLNMLFKGIQERLSELRVQRRPLTTFKIPPGMGSEPQKLASKPAVQPAPQTIEIELGNPITPEILKEEKRENYPSLSAFSSSQASQTSFPPPPAFQPPHASFPPPPSPSAPLQFDPANDIPPPPRKGFLDRFKK